MALIRAVQSAFSRIAPLSLAGSWDNVGTLLDTPELETSKAQRNAVLLTIDLTAAVLDKCPPDVTVIVAYHPPIFSGLKALNSDVSLQRTLMRCIQRGISVYSPHSSLDGCVDGINDFLASGLGEGKTVRLKDKSGVQEGAGDGLLATLDESIGVEEFIKRIKAHLGLKTGLPVLVP